MRSAGPIKHYENFPVASVLCPPRLRAPIAAIYHFARTADDLADEGEAAPEQRLCDLHEYSQELRTACTTAPLGLRWPHIFGPLRSALQQHQLPPALLYDLLSAFEQDITMTRDGQRFPDEAHLLDYCRRSANPVGRLLLHLYGIDSAQALALSDDICTALQLINFWQDLSVDLPRGRIYPTLADCASLGVTPADLLAADPVPNATKLIAAYAYAARVRMLHGAKLVHLVPGRAGWELRLVVQGGLRILDKIEALHFATWRTRPRLRAWDAPLLLWRAWGMG